MHLLLVSICQASSMRKRAAAGYAVTVELADVKAQRAAQATDTAFAAAKQSPTKPAATVANTSDGLGHRFLLCAMAGGYPAIRFNPAIALNRQ